MSAKLLGKSFYTAGLAVWVVFSLLVGQVMAGLLLATLPLILRPAIETTLLAAIGYSFGLAIAIGLPLLITKKPTTKKTLGIDRLPSWSDIGLSILSVLPYYLLSGVMIWLGLEVFKVINPEVGQQIAFENLTVRVEYVVAFITLVVLAPLAEELLFRGYFLGKLNDRIGKWLAVFITALIFGLLHLPGFTDAGLVLQWSAAADTFSLAVIAGILRLLTGSIWAGILLHAFKNAIAFYFLFISPLSS